MSAQSAKKKRVGSRRRVANQNNTSEADAIHISDSTSLAEHSILEENTQSLNVLANPDYSQFETQNPPSPELSGSRRKLGSSRRNKGGRQHVRDTATESYHKPREEVLEQIRGDETPKATLPIQSQRQEELSQESGHDIVSVIHDGSLYSAITPDYSSEDQGSHTYSPEVDLESLIPKSENLQADQDDNETNYEVVSDSCNLEEMMVRGTDESDTAQSEEVEENVHLVGTSELTSLSVHLCPTVDGLLIDQSNSREMPEEEFPNVYSVAVKESRDRDKDTELLTREGNLQDHYLVSESHVKSEGTESSIKPEITTDENKHRENTDLEYSVKQETSSPQVKLPKDEEQNKHLNLFEVKAGHHSEDAVNKVHEEEVMPQHEIHHSSENVTHDATENPEIISGDLMDQAEVTDTYQSELIVKSADDSATKQEDPNPDDKQDEHPIIETNFDASEQTNEDYHVYDTQVPLISDTERVDTGLNQVYEGEGQVEDDVKPSAEQRGDQEKEGLFSEMEESELSSQTLQSETNTPLDSQPQQDESGFNPLGTRRKMGSSRRNKGRRQLKESVTESYNEHKEEVVESSRGNEALETTQMVVATERTSQEELSQGSQHDILSVEEDSSLYSAIMAGYPSEAQNPTATNYPETQLESFIPKSDNLQEDHDERDTDFKMEMSDQSMGATQEGMDESDTLQSQEVSFAHHSEDESSFKLIGKRRKMGSSRRHKGRQQVKESVAESYHRPAEEVVGNTKDNEPLETMNMPLTIETAVQEKSVETKLDGMERFDSAQTEEVRDQVKEDAHVDTLVDISEVTSLSFHSSLKEHQHLIDQSNSMEIPEELPNVYSVTEKESKEGDEDTESLRHDGNLQDNYLVSESHVKSEDIESSIKLEITTEKSNPGEQTEIKFSVDQRAAAISSSKDESSLNEEQINFVNVSQVRGAQYSEDVVNEVHGEAVKATQMQEMHQIDFSSITENESSLQALKSETSAPLDSQPMDNSARTEDQTHTGFNPTGTRRKLGSSRRNKGRQQVKESASESCRRPTEEVVGNTRDNEPLETTNMSSGTWTSRQEEFKEQTDLDVKPAQKTRKIRSVIAEENTEKMSEEDTILSQDVMDNSTVVTADITSSSGRDDSVIEENLIKEPENLSQPTGYDTAKMDSIQSPDISVWKDDSDIQNIPYHDDSGTTSVTLNVLEQKDAYLVQNTEASSCDKDSLVQEINAQQTNAEIETMGDVTIIDPSEAESSIDVQVFGQDEVGEKIEDPKKKDHEPQEMNALLEITQAQLFSAAHNKTDNLAPFDTGLDENFIAEPAANAPEESGISIAAGTCISQQGIQGKTHLDNSENLQGKSKQKRRKMGSTRRTQLNRKAEEGMDDKDDIKESDFNKEADERNFDKMEVVKGLQTIVTAEASVCEEQQETNESSTAHDEGQKLQSMTSDPQNIQSNLISSIDDMKALLPGQSVSHSSMEPSQLDNFTGTEMQGGRNSCSINPLLSSNTEDATNTGLSGGSFVSLYETRQNTQNDEERQVGANIIQDQALKSAEAPAVAHLEIVQSVVIGGTEEEEHKTAQADIDEPNNLNEGAPNKSLEMKNASPNLNSPNRRRKMGSTRRNLRSRSKEDDLHQKQEADNEATEASTHAGDVKAESFPVIKEKELQPHIEDSDSEQRREKVSETVEYSHTAETHFKPPAHQTFEEKPVSHGQLVETEHHPTPSYVPALLSTSPKHDVMSESAFRGRRRKMGSHRKPHGHQSNENQTAGGDDQSITDETAITTEESLGLDKILEVDESDKKPSSSISTPKARVSSSPVSDKTPVQHPYAEIRLDQESHKTFPLAGSSSGAAKRYNVVMIGDSSVGKTSFVKRAQSGKFSSDLPASVGIDTCMWTVVVDGKPVVLQLWDTAGQERFHSITRQIFYKAQAFLLMYDVTSHQTFSAVSYWANCIQEGAAENVTILLLGNKSDHAERQVKTHEGEVLAKEYNFEFMECSAATGENVIQSLEIVARMLSQKVDPREETMVLHKEPQQKKSSGCC